MSDISIIDVINRHRYRFVFPARADVKSTRKGTHRAKLIELLTDGATFTDCVFATWGNDERMTLEQRVRTTYEAVRLLHYDIGYGMRHDLETGVIKLFK